MGGHHIRAASPNAVIIVIAMLLTSCSHRGVLPTQSSPTQTLPARIRRAASVVQPFSYHSSAVAGPTALFYTYQENGAVSREMDATATGTLSDQTLSYAANAANPNFGWISGPNTPGLTSWPAQTYTVTLTVSKPNSALTITRVKVYRVDSAGGPTTSGLALVADLPNQSTSLGTVGTKQFLLNGAAQSAATSDRIGVKFYVHSSSATAQSFAYQAGSGTTSSFTAGTGTPAPSPSGSASPTASPSASPLPSPSPGLAPYVAAVLNDAPKQYFQLSDAAGPVVLDSSRSHSNGTYVGAVEFGLAGPLRSSASKAIGLPGGTASAGAFLPNPNAASGSSYTIEIWVFPLLGSNYMAVWGYNATHRLLVNSSGLLLSQLSGNFFSHRALTREQWHHVVFAYDAVKQVASYYIDGTLDSSFTVPNAAAAFTSTYYLGQYDTSTNYKWNGGLAQSAFYPSALTATQVKQHYNAAGYTVPPTPGPTPSPPPDSPCFGYRWSIKAATDVNASAIDFDDKLQTTSAAYTIIAKPVANNLTPRIAPVETSVYQLTNVTLTLIQKEVDKDEHLLVSDGNGHTVISESADPSCAPTSRFSTQLSSVRKAIDAAVPNVSTTAMHPNIPVTLQGVGFFDYVPNYAIGEAPNGIELHPITAICFGLNCKLSP